MRVGCTWTRRQGYTLLEVLVSSLILGALLLLVMEALSSAQKSWSSTRREAFHGDASDAALTIITQHLRQATLQTHLDYAADGTLIPQSDLHFVCGPARELLGGRDDVCGDAVFFQRPGADQGLPRALQACGFFIRYGDDANRRPALLSRSAPRKRFQLVQLQQSSEAMTLFQVADARGRDRLYSWFADPASRMEQLSVVAENVISMRVRTLPNAQACYDTRRHQWDGFTPSALASRHRLPDQVEVRLILVDELGWSRLNEEQAEATAHSLRQLIQAQGDIDDDSDVLKWAEQHHLTPKLITTTIPLTQGSLP